MSREGMNRSLLFFEIKKNGNIEIWLDGRYTTYTNRKGVYLL